jgi:hypothetical protein
MQKTFAKVSDLLGCYQKSGMQLSRPELPKFKIFIGSISSGSFQYMVDIDCLNLLHEALAVAFIAPDGTSAIFPLKASKGSQKLFLSDSEGNKAELLIQPEEVIIKETESAQRFRTIQDLIGIYQRNGSSLTRPDLNGSLHIGRREESSGRKPELYLHYLVDGRSRQYISSLYPFRSSSSRFTIDLHGTEYATLILKEDSATIQPFTSSTAKAKTFKVW